ncbi:MAG: type III-B CRISPR module RAMP protein Cmr6 [Burkholderiaceae bacterium]|nr:type III-B CRISPR module RAMP protein Cmr6 [Burkholderiaceae bacterium]
MALPLYQGLHAPSQPQPATMHMGLWFERYFDGYASDFGEVDKDARGNWLKALKTQQLGSKAALQDKAAKLQQLATAQGGQARAYHCEGNFVTGLGNPHPLENGFLWHPTLGMPYLPGSAVKGLVRALVETAYHGDDRNAVLKRWFGTEEKGQVADASGCFIFFDALPIQPCELRPEVMTPHMGKWYEKGGKTPQAADTQPGDWHSPVPVGYLVARKLTLQFAIAPRAGAVAPERLQAETANVWLALDRALEWLGAGGKTAIGFGRMESEEGKQRKKAQSAVVWEGARIKFNRANGSLSVEKSGQTASAIAPQGQSLLESLPAELQQKIKGSQFVKVTAYVAEGVLVRVEKA